MRNPITNKPLLAREITVTLAVKFLLIYILWFWFFSNPTDKNLNTSQVQNAIFGANRATARIDSTNNVASDLTPNPTNTPTQTQTEIPEATSW